jgi:hypothetical protein
MLHFVYVLRITSKTPKINVTIQENKREGDKENEGLPPNTEAKDGGKAAKKVHLYCLTTYM